jgi:NAD(P)-dependent dehydrogenase (short-subunit alcohol dehydrogenase family)
VKANVERIVTGLAAELENLPVTAVGVTPGWLRSEMMLENFGVTEASWRDACVASTTDRSAKELIYTAAPDVECTLGGLVSLAEPEPLIRIVRRSQPIAFTRSPAERSPTERCVHISHERALPRKRLVKPCTKRWCDRGTARGSGARPNRSAVAGICSDTGMAVSMAI